MSGSGSDEEGAAVGPTVTHVAIELDDNLKAKLVGDLSMICDVNPGEARSMLETHKWDIQTAIDTFLGQSGDEGEDDDVVELDVHNPSVKDNRDEPAGVDSGEEVIAIADETEGSASASGSTASAQAEAHTSTWAPDTFSVMSWNLDGLDEKNLEKRTEAVVKLIEKENHAVIFFQELLPHTFEYIATKLATKYFPVVGTEDPRADYLTATFLRLNHVIYEDHYIIAYSNTAMGRNLLVTKAFTGRAKLFLLNTHLESTAEFAQQRTAQLKLCFDHCASFPPEYNVIFGGDLNLRDKEVGGLLPSNMSDLWIKCGSRESSRYTWDLTRNSNKQMPSKWQPRLRFDRLYFRDSIPQSVKPEFFGVTGIEKVPLTQSFPSDHWAIISFFKLTPEARQPQINAKKRKAVDAD